MNNMFEIGDKVEFTSGKKGEVVLIGDFTCCVKTDKGIESGLFRKDLSPKFNPNIRKAK